MMPSSLRPSLIVEPVAQGAPPRQPVLAVAASEPPRGRILLVEGEAIASLDLQRALRQAGWRAVGPATDLSEVRALTERGRLDGAVVDLDGLGDEVADIIDLLDEAGVPVLLLATDRERIPLRHRRRTAIRKPCGADQVLAALDRITATDEIIYPVATAPLPWPRVLPQL